MINANKRKPKECGAGPTETDSVSAGQVGVTTALKCIAADQDTGLCTNVIPFVPSRVVFVYLNNTATGGVWIMNTAFPPYTSKNSNEFLPTYRTDL